VRVFVSHYDSPAAAELVRRLRAAGAEVRDSPYSPHAGKGTTRVGTAGTTTASPPRPSGATRS
jgi:hypothetical protein